MISPNVKKCVKTIWQLLALWHSFHPCPLIPICPQKILTSPSPQLARAPTLHLLSLTPSPPSPSPEIPLTKSLFCKKSLKTTTKNVPNKIKENLQNKKSELKNIQNLLQQILKHFDGK